MVLQGSNCYIQSTQKYKLCVTRTFVRLFNPKTYILIPKSQLLRHCVPRYGQFTILLEILAAIFDFQDIITTYRPLKKTNQVKLMILEDCSTLKPHILTPKSYVLHHSVPRYSPFTILEDILAAILVFQEIRTFIQS